MTNPIVRFVPQLAILVTAVLAPAQGTSNLVAVTLASPLLVEANHTSCTTFSSCTPSGIPPTTLIRAGGIAYDGATDTVWMTTGQVLGRYAVSGCTGSCPPSPCPKSSGGAEATGLDVVESLNELWVIDDAGWITRCANTCPPTVNSSCDTGLALSGFFSTTGVAVDDGRGIVFYTSCDFASGVSTLYVSQLATPCTPFSITPLLDCTANLTPCTGLAVDWGAAVVYWTDSRGTHAFPYTYNPSGPSITFGAQTCCLSMAAPTDPFLGLGLRPRGASPSGNPCANGTCPSCPMIHSLRNAPMLGGTLELGLDQAPPSALAWCLLSIGSCTTGGATVPPLCGPILLPGPGPTLGFNATGGTTGCSGSTTFFLPLPAAPAFAGLPIASQCVVICGSLTGTSLSNCLSFVLSAT